MDAENKGVASADGAENGKVDDSYDVDFDCRPDNAYPEDDRQDVIPEHLKQMLAERKGGGEGDNSSEEKADGENPADEK